MKRSEEHEGLEMALLQWLRSRRFLDLLVFGGGTMLRLCHELPRYSADMDFWFFRQIDFDRFFDRLSEVAAREHNVTDSQNKHYSILIEIQRAKGANKLKVEIRKKLASPGASEEKIAFSPHFPTQVLVRGFTLKQMFTNKVEALIDRGEIRDAFDLEFLARRGVSVDLTEGKKKEIVRRLKGFKKGDFDVKLGSIILPDLRDYYRKNRFRYLEEKLCFERWQE
jgi:predicted nucleotidyltransferase component of viral defense system